MRFSFYGLDRHLGEADGASVDAAAAALQQEIAADKGYDPGEAIDDCDLLPLDEMTATAEGRAWAYLDGRWQETRPGTYAIIGEDQRAALIARDYEARAAAGDPRADIVFDARAPRD
jgi:hypothetical protein